jgi:O-antigen/teichoic acid export membrane protein
MMPSRLVKKMNPRLLIGSLFRSSALRAASVLGISGLALACGNLLLARILPPEEFARFVLLYSIVMIGINIGPIGADVILTRRRFDFGAKLHRQVFLTSSAVAVVLAAVSAAIYPLSGAMLASLWVSVAAGGLRTVAVAYYRSRQRFAPALMLTVSTNLAVLVASVAAFFVRPQTALLPAVVMSANLCAVALWGWWAVANDPQRLAAAAPDAASTYPWADSWSAASFIGAGIILTSLDRLVTPELLGMSALALSSVLATIAGSPFTMLYQGVGYTLVPGLRNAHSPAERRRVFKHESLVIGMTCLAAGAAAWWVTPLLLKYVLASRYVISWQLLLVAICVGMLKVIGSLAAGAVNALGSTADLVKLSIVGWVSIAAALIGAAVGARWGLTGLIFGIGVGWIVRTVIIGWLAAPHLADARAG